MKTISTILLVLITTIAAAQFKNTMFGASYVFAYGTHVVELYATNEAKKIQTLGTGEGGTAYLKYYINQNTSIGAPILAGFAAGIGRDGSNIYNLAFQAPIMIEANSGSLLRDWDEEYATKKRGAFIGIGLAYSYVPGKIINTDSFNIRQATKGFNTIEDANKAIKFYNFGPIAHAGFVFKNPFPFSTRRGFGTRVGIKISIQPKLFGMVPNYATISLIGS